MRIALLFSINIYRDTLRGLNRYIKKRNIERKIVSPPQLKVHVLTYCVQEFLLKH